MTKNAIAHYESALKEAFPSGATGDVFHHWNEARKALAEQPAQQEPVAWLHTKIEGVAVPHRPADLDKHPDRWAALYKEPKPCPTCEALARTVMLDQTYHDNISPQRTWVGLMRGVRVEGDTVVISTKDNDAARDLCGALIEEMNK